MDAIKSIRPAIKCASCGKLDKWCTKMAEDTFFCPRCYAAYRLDVAAGYGIKVDAEDILAIFEGRKHVNDVLASRGYKQ